MAEKPLPKWLNNVFFGKALRSGDDPTISVTSSEVKKATAVGDNYASDMYRANVMLTRNGKPEQRSFIVKCSFNTKDKMAELLSKSNIFEKEINTFSILFPEIIRLQTKAFKQNFQPFGPKYIYSNTDVNGTAIVLEDLKEPGFKLAEAPSGLDMKHCLLIMRKIAKYHAASVVLHNEKPELFDKFMDNMFTRGNAKVFEPYFQSNARACAKEVNEWPKDKERFVNKLDHLVQGGLKDWSVAVKRVDAEFTVLIHGDLWKNNMLFKYSEETGEVEDVRFVDYQLSLWSSPAVDLHYFMSSSASAEVLGDTEVMINEYYKSLTETFQLLGCEHLQPTASHINEVFHKRKIIGLVTTLSTRILALADRTSVTDMNKVIAKQDEVRLSEAYKESLRTLLPLYETMGWI